SWGLFFSLFLGEGSRPSESVGHSHFLPAPARPPFHAALVGASFFLNFLILLLHLLLLLLPWQMQTYGYICGRHGLFWPNSEPLRSDTTLEVTLWELISSKIGLRGPDDGSPVIGKVNWHAGIPEQIGILDYFLTAFTGLSPHPNQHHAVP
ncbi:hypothetical protein CPAR01_10521, partial [Colletotrichum paranaense]